MIKQIQKENIFECVSVIKNSFARLLNTYSDHITMPINERSAFENEMKNELDDIGGTINIYDTIDLYLARKK